MREYEYIIATQKMLVEKYGVDGEKILEEIRTANRFTGTLYEFIIPYYDVKYIPNTNIIWELAFITNYPKIYNVLPESEKEHPSISLITSILYLLGAKLSI